MLAPLGATGIAVLKDGEDVKLEENTVPQHDLGYLITLNIGLVLIGFFGGMIGIWAIMKQGNRTAEISERVAGIAERLDARLRRQYADIDRELQDIKEMLGGQ